MERSEAELRARERERVQARRSLILHIVIYLIVNAGLVAIWATTGAGYPWFLWPLGGWGIGILLHVLTYYFFGPESPGEERAITREMQRLQSHSS